MCNGLFSRRRMLGCCGAAALLAGCDSSTGGLDLVSSADVDKLGLRTWEQIKSQVPRSKNGSMQGQVNASADRLLRAAGENPNEWEAVVFAQPQINAFALPGKKIGVYEGMFKAAKTQDQLAAVIGHEIGHVQARHGEARIEREMTTGIGLAIAEAALRAGGVSGAGDIAQVLGTGAQYGLILPYSRGQELEADSIGLRLMAGAQYDPAEAVTLWQNMSRANGGNPPEFLSTHPAPASRIQRIEAQLPVLKGA